MEAQSLSTCNQCGKKFQRKAHLLRHQQQHSGDRPYSCKFCSKTFKRSDVLRDHFSRCDQRGSSEIPSSLERGRKRHACDECSRLKIKCDNEVPCRKCREFGRTCVKSRPTAASSPDETHSNTTTPDLAGSDRNSIGFLLNCPGETDFMREFPKDSTLSPNNKLADFSNLMSLDKSFEPFVGDLSGAAPVYNGYGHIPQVENNLDAFLSHLEFQTFHQETQNWQMPGEDLMLWSAEESLFLDRNVLEQRAFDIREKLKYAAAMLDPPNHPSKEVLDATEIITANNVAGYIKLYFKHWHKHAPMVHEATFNPCTAALPLVLALMSLGGMYGSNTEEIAKLKLLLDTIESYVYSIPGLNEEYDLPGRQYVRQRENSSLEWRQYQLQELQGAYLMIVLQYWTGNAIARIRVRQQRFPRIVAIFHHLDLQAVQHPQNFVISDQLSFKSWVLTESYVRTATFALMLDNAFGIFNNVSPRFQWAEIDLTFPSDDRFFAIANYDEVIAHSVFPVRKMKIKDAFLVLFSPREKAEEGLAFLRSGNLTALDMQMLIHFIYTHVWASTFSNPLAQLPLTNIHAVVQPFKTAMHNWKIMWDEIKAAAGENEWNKLGFQRTAETYYDAVQAIVLIFENKQGKFPPIPSDCEKGSHLKRLLSF